MGLLRSLPMRPRSGAANGRQVRVVSVSSGAHKRARVGRTLEEINGASTNVLFGKYGQSKLAQIMWTKQLQRRIDSARGQEGTNLLCVSVTPGFARTGIFKRLGELPAWQRAVIAMLWPIVLAVSRTARGGAQVVVMACAGDVKGGAYYSNCEEKPTEGADGCSNDPECWAALWNLTQDLLARCDQNK